MIFRKINKNQVEFKQLNLQDQQIGGIVINGLSAEKWKPQAKIGRRVQYILRS